MENGARADFCVFSGYIKSLHLPTIKTCSIYPQGSSFTTELMLSVFHYVMFISIPTPLENRLQLKPLRFFMIISIKVQFCSWLLLNMLEKCDTCKFKKNGNKIHLHVHTQFCIFIYCKLCKHKNYILYS